MSTETESNGSTTSQQRVEKNILMTAYAAEDAEYEDAREFIADVFDLSEMPDEAIDPYAETTRTSTDINISFNFEVEDPRFGNMNEVTETFNPFSSRTKRHFKAAIDDGIIDADELDWVDVSYEETESTSFDHSVSSMIKKSLRPTMERIPFASMGYEIDDYPIGIISARTEVPNLQPDAEPGETDELYIRVTTGHDDTIKERQVLRPMAERIQSDRFEDGAERWSFEVTTDIEATSEEDMETIEKAISGTLLDFFDSNEAIDATRLTECEVVTTEHGSCHSV